MPVTSRLRVVQGGAVLLEPVTADPWEFQADCVEAFVASWRARGFSPVTVENDIGLLERTLTALGRPAWEVTPEDIERVVGDLALAGRAASTRREYVQIFKGFHRFLQARKAVEIEAGFGVRLVCPVDEFNAARHVGGDSLAQLPPPTPERVAGRLTQPVSVLGGPTAPRNGRPVQLPPAAADTASPSPMR
ncbi:hypothetical protein GCM10010207_65240 [Streptomyces atratus]|nr:hypothetical protein GCM10010207_65240 [Streptomyces atratus]